MGTERNGGALHALGAGAGPRRALLAGSGVFALLVALAAMGSPRYAGAFLGALAGLIGLGALVRFAPARSADVLLLGTIGLLAIPVDVYLGYQTHVGGWPGLRISLADLCLYALVPIAGLGLLLGRLRQPIPLGVAVLAALLLLQYGLSALFAPNRMLAFYEIASTLHAFLLAWIVALLLRRDLLRGVLALLALQVIVHSVFALAQGVTGRPIGAGWLGGSSVVLEEALQGGASRLRPAGLFAHPIVYATFLVVTLPLLAAGLALRASAVLRVLLATALALGAVGLVLTLSRGAWISAAVAGATLLALALRRGLLSARRLRAIGLAVLATALVLGVVLGPRIYDRLTRSDAGNVEVRFDLNRIALRMIAANPVLGTGLNNFTDTMEPYDPQNVMAYFPAPVHQLYLLEAAEAGIPALLLFVGLFAAILVRAIRRLSRLGDRELAWLAAALVAGLTGFLVSQLADFSHRLEPLRSMIWCDVGLLLGILSWARPGGTVTQAR